MSPLLLMGLLLTKHLVVDFFLQGPYQYKNKGTFGHPGGILHASLHGLGTLVVFTLCGFGTLSIALALLDACSHYLIDYTKVQINRRAGWGPTTHEQFWWLLGIDQWAHQMIYILMVALAVTT